MQLLHSFDTKVRRENRLNIVFNESVLIVKALTNLLYHRFYLNYSLEII